MWTSKNRGRYDRSALRYPSDLTDDEWALCEPLIPPARRGGNKRHVDEREVVNGLMYVLSTGCQWRAIPKDLPPRLTALRCWYDRRRCRGAPPQTSQSANFAPSVPAPREGLGLHTLFLLCGLRHKQLSPHSF